MNQELKQHDREQIETHLAQMQGSNIEWLRANENRLIQEHPEYWGKHLVVCSRLANPVLAIEEDVDDALRIAEGSDEVQQLAAVEGFDPRSYLSWVVVGGGY